MYENDLEKWEDFEPELHKILKELEISEEDVLYRGHADNGWKLETTLERYTHYKFTIYGYLSTTLACRSQIESFTNHKFEISDYESIIHEIQEKSDITYLHLPPFLFEYWAYLRHFGFPSPYLDWTSSLYIAAFFAFADMKIDKDSRCAIYAYIEKPFKSKVYSDDRPNIYLVQSDASAHKRHFLQQSQYTIALQKDLSEYSMDSIGTHKISSHETVIDNIPKSEVQDFMLKFTFPISQRKKVLKYLNKFNVNYFSLMQNDESLIKTLAYKEIGLRE